MVYIRAWWVLAVLGIGLMLNSKLIGVGIALLLTGVFVGIILGIWQTCTVLKAKVKGAIRNRYDRRNDQSCEPTVSEYGADRQLPDNNVTQVEPEPINGKTFVFSVVGTQFEGRYAAITSLIKNHLQDMWPTDKYNGMSDEEILEDGFIYDQSYPVWEIGPGECFPVRLVPEPENRFDPNAVAVQSENGLMLGYVPRDQAAEVANACRERDFIKGLAYIKGGRYKYVSYTSASHPVINSDDKKYELQVYALFSEATVKKLSDDESGEMTLADDALKILRNVVKDNGGKWNVGGYRDHKVKLTIEPQDNGDLIIVSTYPTPPRARIPRSGQIAVIKSSNLDLTAPIECPAIVREGFGEMEVIIDVKQN